VRAREARTPALRDGRTQRAGVRAGGVFPRHLQRWPAGRVPDRLGNRVNVPLAGVPAACRRMLGCLGVTWAALAAPGWPVPSGGKEKARTMWGGVRAVRAFAFGSSGGPDDGRNSEPAGRRVQLNCALMGALHCGLMLAGLGQAGLAAACRAAAALAGRAVLAGLRAQKPEPTRAILDSVEHYGVTCQPVQKSCGIILPRVLLLNRVSSYVSVAVERAA
jgi:hypothetical protein